MMTGGEMALLQTGLGAMKGAQSAPSGQWVDLGYGRRAWVPNRGGALAGMLGGAAQGGMSELMRQGMVDEGQKLDMDKEARRDDAAREMLGLQQSFAADQAQTGRDWQSGESQANRDFQLNSASDDRSFRREESGLDRLMRTDALEADKAYKSRYLDAMTEKAEKKSMSGDELYSLLMQNDFAEGKSATEADSRAKGFTALLYPGWGGAAAGAGSAKVNPLTDASNQQNSLLEKLKAVPQILDKNAQSAERWKRQGIGTDRMYDGLWKNGAGIGGF